MQVQRPALVSVRLARTMWDAGLKFKCARNSTTPRDVDPDAEQLHIPCLADNCPWAFHCLNGLCVEAQDPSGKWDAVRRTPGRCEQLLKQDTVPTSSRHSARNCSPQSPVELEGR